jgi:thiol:disulfide interchange protein DsbC
MRRLLLIPLILMVIFVQGGMTQEDDMAIVKSTISAALKGAFGEIDVSSIRKSGLQGMYEVMMGAEIIYISGDGQYVFQGDLIDIKNLRNLSEERRSLARVDLLASIPSEEIIEFSPEDPEHYLYVFTDITCVYCQRLHKDIEELNSRGIGVRYLAFPRSGLNSPTFVDMESVWCAKDQHTAFTDAIIEKSVVPASCANSVASQFNLGKDMGVNGTPAVYLETGQQIGGYVQPDKIVQYLEGK